MTDRRNARPDDARRLAKLSTDLTAAYDSCDGVLAEINRFVDDVDSDRIVVGGVVEAEHEDTTEHRFVTRRCQGSSR